MDRRLRGGEVVFHTFFPYRRVCALQLHSKSAFEGILRIAHATVHNFILLLRNAAARLSVLQKNLLLLAKSSVTALP